MFTNIFQDMFHNKIICFPFSKILYNWLNFKDANLDISPCIDFIKYNSDKYSYYKHSLGFFVCVWSWTRNSIMYCVHSNIQSSIKCKSIKCYSSYLHSYKDRKKKVVVRILNAAQNFLLLQTIICCVLSSVHSYCILSVLCNLLSC